MCFFCKLSEKKNFKSLDCIDTKLIILAVMAFALMLVKIFPLLLAFNWYTYLIVAVVALLRPCRKMKCGKKCDNV